MKALHLAADEPALLSDKQVVQRVLSGEKQLFEILMRRHNQVLYRIIRSYLRDEASIEDVMQETYLNAYHKLWQFHENAAFSTWLIRIGINESLKSLRNNAKQLNVETITEVSAIHNNSPERFVINRETAGLIEKLIDQLPEKYRVVFVLKEVEGLDNKAICECLDLEAGNVKVRLHRARKLLQDALNRSISGAGVFEFGNKRCDMVVEAVMKQIG